MEKVFCGEPGFLYPRDGADDLHDGDGQPALKCSRTSQHEQGGNGGSPLLHGPGVSAPARIVCHESPVIFTLCPCTGEWGYVNSCFMGLKCSNWKVMKKLKFEK